MRVIAGEKKGFPLKSPKGTNTRPTSDKIKGAIFNSLSNYINFYDKEAIDCFSGTGSLGIEFLSRGGNSCVFFDLNEQSITCIKENITKTNYQSKSKVVKANVINFLSNNKQRSDIFFIDPPYNKELAQKCVDLIVQNDLLKEEGALVVETDKAELISYDTDYLELITEKNYGGTKISILLRR